MGDLRLIHRAQEVVDLLLCLIPLVAVAFLELAQELVFLAADNLPVIVGQLAPLCFGLPHKLLPVAFNHVPIHGLPPFVATQESDSSRNNVRKRRAVRDFLPWQAGYIFWRERSMLFCSAPRSPLPGHRGRGLMKQELRDWRLPMKRAA